MDTLIKVVLAALYLVAIITPLYYIPNKKIGGGVSLAAVILLSWGLSQFHGGVMHMTKTMTKCVGEGDSVQMESSYSMIWNTCSINRGTPENPKWVISSRDVGVEVEL